MITQQERQPLILCGAGMNLSEAYARLSNDYDIVGISDNSSTKQGQTMYVCGKQGKKQFTVMSMDNALSLYPNALIYVTPDEPIKCDIINFLISSSSISKDRIINYIPYEKKRSCHSLNNLAVFGIGSIGLCCGEGPAYSITENVKNEFVLKEFLKIRQNTVNAISDNNVPDSCQNCPHLKDGLFSKNAKIDEIYLVFPIICQFKCIYCTDNWSNEDIAIKNLEYKMDFIDWLYETGHIDKNTMFRIAMGEITVTPNCNRVFKTAKKFPCKIFTNAQFYSEEIGEILSIGRSGVNVSIDAGTAQTFAKVKGIDCFTKVKENIIKYSKKGYVEIKYIILPGYNDNPEDVSGFIDLAIQANAKVIVSRDAFGTEKFEINIGSCLDTIEMIFKKAKNNHLSVGMTSVLVENTQYSERILQLISQIK